MKLALLLLLTTGSFALSHENPCAESEPTEIAEDECDGFKVFVDPNGDNYFPIDRAFYYTRYLAAMKEPSVKSPLPEGVNKTLRLTYLRSFHDPIAIRFTMRNETIEMRSVRLEKDREHRLVRIIHDETKILNPEDSAAIAQILEMEDLWEELTDIEMAVMGITEDGAAWIFEKHDADGYKMVDLNSPQHVARMAAEGILKTDKNFALYFDVGVSLLKQGGVLPPKEDLY